MNNLQLFMMIYMYELELYLNSHKDKILNISFQSDEANTDRPLKEYLRYVIQNEFNCITETIAEIITKDTKSPEKRYAITNDIKNIYIEQVLLPNELTTEIEHILKSRKNAVYTNPDICLKINENGQIKYETIELKSTKDNSIPGSSVQQISPHEWVVFIKHSNASIEITTGQYIHAINSKMQFPDRSPRPQVSFNELKNWNTFHRISQDKILYFHASIDESSKHDLINDWQGVLAKRWKDVLFSYDAHREPWFNNTLRKFILEFLKIYDEMDETKKEEYKSIVKSLIQ